MHFSLAGSLSRFGCAIGCIALLNSSTSAKVVDALATLVKAADEPASMLDAELSLFAPDADPRPPLGQLTSVAGFTLQGGSCVVVTLPAPICVAEAHFAAIVVGDDLQSPDVLRLPRRDIPLLYFTLEKAEPNRETARTIVGEWTVRGARRNYGYGCLPRVEDFVEVIERLWVSGIWKET
jgi:hypothetical protein